MTETLHNAGVRAQDFLVSTDDQKTISINRFEETTGIAYPEVEEFYKASMRYRQQLKSQPPSIWPEELKDLMMDVAATMLRYDFVQAEVREKGVAPTPLGSTQHELARRLICREKMEEHRT